MDRPPRFNFYRLVGRNLRNRPGRNIPTVIAFAVIGATLFSALYLASGMEQSLYRGTKWMGADLMIVPGEYTAAGENILLTGSPTTFFFDDSGFERISQVPGVEKASPEVYIATLLASCCAAPVQIIAIDPDHDFTISAWLRDKPGIRLGKDDIIIGSKIDGDTGSDLMFYGHEFHIVGKLEPTGLRGVDMAVFTRIEDAYVMADESGEKAVKNLTIPRGMVSTVLVKVAPGASPAAVGDEIRRQVPGTKVITPTGLLHTVSGHIEGVMGVLYGSTLAIAAAFILLFGVISAMVAHELRKEITILGALGVTKAFVLRLVFAESFSLSIIGGLLGIGAATVILIAFQDFIASRLKIPFGIPSAGTLMVSFGIALLALILIGLAASVYPTVRLVRSEAFRAIRSGR
ncbi:MAG: FtsX-like permease family protein [Methanoregulaceae archaeon]|nr:FtsX-like permease family protein [Methanoregulaceae archaeon]